MQIEETNPGDISKIESPKNMTTPTNPEGAFKEITTIELTEINPIMHDTGNEVDKDELYECAKMFKECNQSDSLIIDSYWYAILAGSVEAALDFSQMFLKGEIVSKNKSFALIFESVAKKLDPTTKLYMSESVTFEEERVSDIIAQEIKKTFSKGLNLGAIDNISNIINIQLQSSANSEEDICFDRCIKSYFTNSATNEVDIETTEDNIKTTGNLFDCINICTIL